jgi:hypothetical protein
MNAPEPEDEQSKPGVDWWTSFDPQMWAKIHSRYQLKHGQVPDSDFYTLVSSRDGSITPFLAEYLTAINRHLAVPAAQHASRPTYNKGWLSLALWSLSVGMTASVGTAVMFGTSWANIVVGATTMVFAAAMVRAAEPVFRWRPRRPITAISVRTLTSVAAFLAGPRRPALRHEWGAHLAGDVGHDPASWQKVRQAAGFIVSAVRCRCSDIADTSWTPVDAILKSRTFSNLFVLMPTAGAAYLVLRHEGTLGVVKSAEGVAAIGTTLYGLIRVGRWWRNVKPPEPKARRVKE